MISELFSKDFGDVLPGFWPKGLQQLRITLPHPEELKLVVENNPEAWPDQDLVDIGMC